MNDLPKETTAQTAARKTINLLRNRWKVPSVSSADYDQVELIIQDAIIEVLTGDQIAELLVDTTKEVIEKLNEMKNK